MAKLTENKAKKASVLSSKVSPLELLTFMGSLFYFQSILTIAHHVSFWPQDGQSKIVESPPYWLPVLGIIVIVNSFVKNKFSLKSINLMSLTIFIISTLFWLSGLRTNFYW